MRACVFVFVCITEEDVEKKNKKEKKKNNKMCKRVCVCVCVHEWRSTQVSSSTVFSTDRKSIKPNPGSC